MNEKKLDILILIGWSLLLGITFIQWCIKMPPEITYVELFFERISLVLFSLECVLQHKKKP